MVIFTLVFCKVKSIYAQGSGNFIEKGGQTEKEPEDGEQCYNMLSSRLEGQCTYEPMRPAHDQASQHFNIDGKEFIRPHP